MYDLICHVFHSGNVLHVLYCTMDSSNVLFVPYYMDSTWENDNVLGTCTCRTGVICDACKKLRESRPTSENKVISPKIGIIHDRGYSLIRKLLRHVLAPLSESRRPQWGWMYMMRQLKNPPKTKHGMYFHG